MAISVIVEVASPGPGGTLGSAARLFVRAIWRIQCVLIVADVVFVGLPRLGMLFAFRIALLCM